MSKGLYTTIVETTPPTSETAGVIGQWYLDKTANKLYQYRSSGWEEIAAGAGGTSVTVGGVAQATFDADTKANASDVSTINTMIGEIDEELSTQSQSILNIASTASTANSTANSVSAQLVSLSSTVATKEGVAESGTNFIKYSSGLLICFGQITKNQGTSGLTIQFAKPFVDTTYSLITQQERESGIGATYVNGQGIGGKSTTQAGLYMGYNENSIINWIAIGKWK